VAEIVATAAEARGIPAGDAQSGGFGRPTRAFGVARNQTLLSRRAWWNLTSPAINQPEGQEWYLQGLSLPLPPSARGHRFAECSLEL